MNGIELSDPDRGVFAAAEPGGAGIIFDHDEVLASGPARVEVEVDGSRRRATLALEDVALEAELTPLAPPLRLRGELSGEIELTLCQALGSLRHPQDATEVACLAVASQTLVAPAAAVELRRSLTIAFADGGLTALRLARPAGAGGHGEEEVAVAVLEPGGRIGVTEALLSTEYDGAGRQRRATLELWPEGEPALRGAGRLICGATLEAEGSRVEAAFFRWSFGGRPGLGRYEIVSAA